MSQDSLKLIQTGYTYTCAKAKELEQYNRRLEAFQLRWLKRLERNDRRLLQKLRRSDSASYAAYISQTPSYDSIRNIARQVPTARLRVPRNIQVDSLRKVLDFSGAARMGAGRLPDLDTLAGRLNHREYVNELIQKRGRSLNRIGGVSAGSAHFRRAQKQLYYGRERAKAFRQLTEDPSEAEAAALEYLQGTKGFDQAMRSREGGGPPKTLPGATDGAGSKEVLAAAGIQTKENINAMLAKQFGASNMAAVQAQAGRQIQELQGKITDTRNKARDAANTLKQLKQTDKPSFRINPMREKPFLQRIETQYTLNSFRPSGGQPARADIGFMAGFRHTERLSYGAGLAVAAGLGYGLDNIRLGFSGAGFRSYAKLEWQYGLGGYAGYERLYNHFAFTGTEAEGSLLPNSSVRNRRNYTESVLVGITKKYNISPKWNGSLQLLWDVWWRENNVKSPFVFRFNYSK